MGKFEDTVKQAVCSDTGKLLVPAVPGVAIGVLTSWTGPGAIAAGGAAGMATSAAQQAYCDGKVEVGTTLLGGAAGGAGKLVAVGGKALIGVGLALVKDPAAIERHAAKVTDIGVEKWGTTVALMLAANEGRQIWNDIQATEKVQGEVIKAKMEVIEKQRQLAERQKETQAFQKDAANEVKRLDAAVCGYLSAASGPDERIQATRAIKGFLQRVAQDPRFKHDAEAIAKRYDIKLEK